MYSIEDWKRMQDSFEMDEPFPDEILYAEYECEYYEGWADVIYRNGDKFYWARGSHCSCYGLEGQWDPEEYSAELFVAVWERGNYTQYRPHIPSSVLDRVKEFLENNYNGA